MTIKEALKRFKWKYNLTKDCNDPHWESGERREHSEWVEQLEVAINAIEKQIPKKPSETDKVRCIHCGCVVKRDERFCKNCGQALD